MGPTQQKIDRRAAAVEAVKESGLWFDPAGIRSPMREQESLRFFFSFHAAQDGWLWGGCLFWCKFERVLEAGRGERKSRSSRRKEEHTHTKNMG